MAKLSYKERLERLESRYNELVKPVFVIAEQQEESIEAVAILSNSKRVPMQFSNTSEFLTFKENNPDCNIICNEALLSLRSQTCSEIVAELDTQTLQEIAEDKLPQEKIERLFTIKLLERL